MSNLSADGVNLQTHNLEVRTGPRSSAHTSHTQAAYRHHHSPPSCTACNYEASADLRSMGFLTGCVFWGDSHSEQENETSEEESGCRDCELSGERDCDALGWESDRGEVATCSGFLHGVGGEKIPSWDFPFHS
eukprot:TRINITY_DN6823_c0_g2_i1.p2 TRINITY_DN6823_c0_g2~~TRINITY_DN6823_c0_g2_i1.p2  ORF type:complete len:133 (+),score=14.34 TRINITY_DN6823_c0_g2_i1:602-1000(+)